MHSALFMMRRRAGTGKLGYSAFAGATTLALVLACLSVAARHVRAQTTAAPFVIVQAVDESWLPVPGADVELRERRGMREVRTATTNRDGLAAFRFDAPDARQSYDISVTMAGFKTAEMKDVRFGSCTGDCPSSRYVQLRLAVAGPAVTIR